MKHLFQRFHRDIIGIIWMAIGIFLALSLWSFSPADPSFNSIGDGLTVQNYCGYFGSFLADLLYQTLGIAAWVFVVAAFRMSYLAFRGFSLERKGGRLLWASLLIVVLASQASLLWPQKTFFDGQVMVGGVLGFYVSKSLISVFNYVGVSIILWTLILVFFVFYTEKSLKEWFLVPKALWTYLWGVGDRKFFLFGDFFRKKAEGLGRGIFFFKKAFFKEHKKHKEQLHNQIKSLENKEVHRRFLLIDEKRDSIAPQKYLKNRLKENERKNLPKLSFKKKKKISLKKKVQRKIENWELPKLDLLEDPPAAGRGINEKEVREKGALLINKLEQFSVRGKILGVKPGPAVTMFEFKPNADVKISKITDLADDLSLALSSESVRIIAPIPGRNVVGIETSNSERKVVYLKEILATESFWDESIQLPLALGCKADGSYRVVDLRKMPHLMVAGSTGSGKSVFVVSLLTGLLFRHSPKTLKLILIDPKQVDLAAFSKIPHLCMPPIRSPKKALGALKWAIREMEKRYRSMAKFGARGIESFNEKVSNLSKQEFQKHEEFNEQLEGRAIAESYYYTPQPYMVIVIEEFGDLMAVDKNNVEQSVVRLAQMARACGIHLILALQSPRKDVVTGLIKTNIPGRVSFKVASKLDSRVILDESGAERLLSRGDMLFLAPGVSKPERHHGPWLTDEEIQAVTTFCIQQAEPDFDPLALKAIEGTGGGFDLSGEEEVLETEEMDEKYDEILAFVASQREVSASLLQRRFRLGYPRAARLIEVLESEGVIGPPNGSKPRQVLINEMK
ncbi:MAG: DNA translocase FtsK [Bdellovibrio sp.]|nr:MAG: DNA translocase FtsK [Bdellovibrio sp.]